MDRLRRKRAPERGAVTKITQNLEAELMLDPINEVAINAYLASLDTHAEKLSTLDEELNNMMLDDTETTEDEYQAEFDAEAEYQEKVMLIKAKVSAKVTHRSAPSSPSNSFYSTDTSRRSSSGRGSRFKLPKIELKKFSGDLKEWLGWWAQFEKIHEDEDLHNADKFDYLCQAMVRNSRSAEFISSYPPTSDNYPKAIGALKDRFGKPNLLKQVYVRELIGMILSNKSKERMSLAFLYDRLECHLRSLESLGVTVEQMVEFLFPMVESCLPEETLTAWQRSPDFGRDGSKEDPPRSELDFLLSFLKREIDNEEQKRLARNGFETERRKSHRKEEEDLPTAAGLFSGSSRSVCIFCDKQHESKACFQAKKMTLDERKSKVQEKKACFSCLKVDGHRAKGCKFGSKCQVCERKHPILLCPELSARKEGAVITSTTLNCTSEVLLRTLVLKAINPVTKRWKEIRILLDCGSQKTYLRSRIAKELRLTPKSNFLMNHQLFGGNKVVGVRHKSYDVTLSSDTTKFTTTLEVLDQDSVCDLLPRVSQGEWMEELREMGITINDSNPTKSREIDMLIGSDILGQFLTGKVIQLRNGLTATETSFGWCLMGPIGQSRRDPGFAMTSLTMSVLTASIRELWDLDTLGIRDPIEVQTKNERERRTEEHFRLTVARGENGRYKVNLPWTQVGNPVPNNREVAFRRLESTTRKLESSGHLGDYDKIFQDWEREGIVSIVDSKENPSKRILHYLPHRAVLKPESTTTPIRPVFDASSKSGRNQSLNDCLEKGPNLLELIRSILLRFRI